MNLDPPPPDRTARLVQLSDLHLTARKGRRTRGVDPWEHLRRMLAALERYEPFERLILSGDLANRPSRNAYASLRSELAPWLDRVRWIPGNHDGRGGLRAAFADRGGSTTFADEVRGWRLVGLDSKRAPFVHGKVGGRQREWLREVLRGSPQVLLFVHHPPARIGTWWLDKDVLRDARALAEVVRGAPVRAVFCGHVHQPAEGTFAGVPVYCCPSTAYQFRPGSLWPASIASRAPAFRVIDLGADRLTTRIEPLP